MDKKLVRSIEKVIGRSKRILITSHKRPDGDAVGSVLGLGFVLQDTGKSVEMVLEDGVPENLNHLPGSEFISTFSKQEYDTSIVLDCSDLQRVGQVIEKNTLPTINIDHHITNQNFAEINLVNPKDPATTIILTKIFSIINLTISRKAADALLTGLITDTIGFRTNNMTPESLRIAADLMELGADLPALYKKALLDKSYQAARYWGAGLSTIRKENRILWATLTLEDRNITGYPGIDDADLINFLTTIKDADLFIIFIEQPDGYTKVSWRTTTDYDVSKIATLFGGGGHKPAAGATIPGCVNSVAERVLVETRKLLLQ
jgi:phosphoesterase RecJ-like protein